MQNTIITDTGFWLALIDRRDTYHQCAVEALQRYRDARLITTWCVMTETCHLLLKRKGHQAQTQFMRSFSQGSFSVFDLQPHHSTRISDLMEQYQDLPMDLADASLVVLAEYLGHGRIFSVDQRDFYTYRWTNTHPFENLLILR